MKKTILIFFLFFNFQLLFSFSWPDSLNYKPSLISSFRENGFFIKDSIQPVLYKLDRFQNYNYRYTLGNLGLASQELIFMNNLDLGFIFSQNGYSYNYFNPKKNIYYNSRVPYSEIFYVAGSKKEQFFKLNFSYNVKKKWNLSVDFKKLRSEGFYLRQNSAQTYFAISTNYVSNNNRYAFLGSIIYNAPNHIENGGIARDSLFENQTGVSKNALPINLQSARKKISNCSFYFKQYFNLGKKSADTTQAGIMPSSSFILATYYKEDRYKYSDDNPSSGYYDNIYIDSSLTNDSVRLRVFDNELEWKRWDNKKHSGFFDLIGVALKYRNQLIWFKQMQYDTLFVNSFVGAEIYNTYSNNDFWVKALVNYCISGYNSKDYKYAFGLTKLFFNKNLNLNIYSNLLSQSPDYIFNRYVSNHFDWSYNFNKTQTSSIGTNVLYTKYNLRLNLEYSRKSNVIYFDNYALPKQYFGNILVFKAELSKDFVFKGFHIENNIVYQYVPDSLVIRLPEIVLNHTIYYETGIFKKAAMRIQFGASLNWFSGYYANAFMPATSQFYLQNERKIGNYPFVDFFVNAKIKMVRIFIKIDHLNSGLTGSNYFIANHYPINDRAFKLGISWRFLD